MLSKFIWAIRLLGKHLKYHNVNNNGIPRKQLILICYVLTYLLSVFNSLYHFYGFVGRVLKQLGISRGARRLAY